MSATQTAAVTQVYDVLIATFPGRPTDGAVDELQQDVLSLMEEIEPRGVVLDVSAVTTLDSFFARVISETASMVELLGGEAIVVGMRPSVAITAAELGFGLDTVKTARSTDHALSMLGVRVDDEESATAAADNDTAATQSAAADSGSESSPSPGGGR